MPDRLTLLSALAAVLLVLPHGVAAQDRVVPPSAEALRMSYAPIVKRVVPAVVTVSAAIEEKVMPIDTMIDTNPGQIRIDGYGDACTRSRALRIHHPYASMSTQRTQPAIDGQPE